MRKTDAITIPKLRQSTIQGEASYCLLEIINKKPFRDVSEVREEFKPFVLKYREGRANDSPALLNAFKKQMATKEGQEKIFDTEYCLDRDFLIAFDFINPLGSANDEKLTLTLFGSCLLNNCKKNGSKDIFHKSNKEFLGRVYSFVDDYKKWNILQVIEKKGPISLENLAQTLMNLKRWFDIERTKKWALSKTKINQQLREEWQKDHGDTPMDYTWKKERVDAFLKDTIKVRGLNHLEEILKFYSLTSLIKKDVTLFSCDINYINELKKRKFWVTSEDVTNDKFFEVLYTCYQDLVKSNKDDTVVTIPALRKEVCLKLNMLWPSFDKIIGMQSNGYKEYQISLVRASARKRLGLYLGANSFYYITIKKISEV